MKKLLFITAMAITSILEGKQVIYADDVKGIIADKIIEIEHLLRDVEDDANCKAYYVAQIICAQEIYVRINELLIEKY